MVTDEERNEEEWGQRKVGEEREMRRKERSVEKEEKRRRERVKRRAEWRRMKREE